MRKILFILGLLCGSALAQGGGQVIVGNFGIQYVSTAPSGSCSGSSPFTQTTPAGSIYTCQNGTWASAGGGGGAVTSVFTRTGAVVAMSGDYTCAQVTNCGTGSVTTVGFTGGLISVATPTSTPALTVAGTSGGIPYFSGASTWASSGALTQYGVVFGGGAGNSPTVSAQGGSNFPLIGQGASNPIFSTIAYPTSLTSGGFLYASSATAFAGSALITANVLPKSGGAGTAPAASSITDNATTVTTSDTGGFVGPTFTSNGTTAGFIDYPQGSTSASVAPCNTANSICDQAPTSVTAGVRTLPGALAQGVLTNTGTSSALTQGYSGDANHSATVSWSTATSISSTSLCSSGNCPVGTYRISAYIDVTTACTTTGSYVVNVIYTDDTTVSKTIVIPLVGLGITTAFGPTALSATLIPTSTTDFGTGSFILRSTGTTSINYSTTAGACGTGGPGVGKLYLVAEPIQ